MAEQHYDCSINSLNFPMTNQLHSILLQKETEVQALYQRRKKDPSSPLAKLLRGEISVPVKKSFSAALQQPGLSVIAEIKRRSPSKGLLAEIEDPVGLARRYQQGGASALSILTDEKFFGGSLQDLIQVTEALASNPLPVLRKDFVIDPIQIAEAALAGASAVLVIVAVLGAKTATIIKSALALQLDVLVEVHDAEELNMALDAGATIIGINNRNLKTFEIDTNRALNLTAQIPRTILRVAESGITTPALARAYHQAGFDGILIGEALVRSEDPKFFIHECIN